MGADIHGVVQTRWADGNGGNTPWRSEMEIEDGRNYMLFSILADVRNYGNIEPIDEPRGLPSDFEMDDKGMALLYYSNGEVWMGDHSHTYYSLEELLGWPGWEDPEVRERCGTFIAFLKHVDTKYRGGHYEVRLVIGFDS